MKNLFTCFAILLLFSGTLIQAQYSYTPGKSGQNTGTVTSDLDFIPVYLYFHNNSSDSVKVIWRLLQDSLPTGWDIGLCDNVNCYYNAGGSLIIAKTSDYVHAGDSMFLKAQFDPHCISGEGTFTISAKPQDGSFNSPDTLTYRVTALAECANGISESEVLSDLKVFPNPANDFVNVSAIVIGNQTLRIQLTDLQGRVVSSVQSLKPDMSLNISALPSGPYFVQFKDSNERILAVRKIFKL